MNFRITHYVLLLEFMKTMAAFGNLQSKDKAKIRFEWEMFTHVYP